MMWLFLVLIITPMEALAEVKCHSCLTHCKTVHGAKVDPVGCDCLSAPEEMCLGNACFAKVEIFTDEKTAIMQKGCITDVPGNQKGCQYASNNEALHCFCEENECNTRQKMNNFMTNRLPTVECCGCSERHGDHCPTEGCLRKCRGNYCVVDFDGIEQGCGLGFPRLQSFLRMKSYLDYQGSLICARYEATAGTVMNGCTCTQPSGSCNELNKTRHFQVKKVIERRLDDQNYCYSLNHKSSKPFGQEVFKKSTTCEGQFCFISLTTSEIVLESADFKRDYAEHDEFIGTTRPRYELLAGCLKVDDDEKITVGCTTEYLKNASDPLSKHCICDSHLCNFHHLVSGREDPRPRATKKQQDEGEHSQNSIPRTSKHPHINKFSQNPFHIMTVLALIAMVA
ncbi:Activin types I and II receptor domain protein [Trichostrongylus colubriformis]|uniref:Activin types I and II receptor domain protein n=1 Tax=Trichostrongylus colubriformis TaxID=6319 RepID=A0AAN8EZG2_TRICO